ncbi:MAG: hypothetical protein HY922_13490 [Elusimicrobia bacterium]|nr:hypothetical protein [Elusimicrobiota bacterium]
MTEKRPDPGADLRRLRNFGFLMGGVLVALSWPLGRKGFAAAPYFLALGGLGILAALARPSALEPFERYWMKFARALGRINTAVILTLLYYLVLTPYGFLMRLFTGDPVDRGFEKDAASYWKRREPVERISYERQF